MNKRIIPRLSELIADTFTFFGDDHNMNQGREWLAKQISNSRGLNFLALEYVESNHQDLILNFDKQKLFFYLKKKYRDFPMFNLDSVANLIYSCKKAGIKAIGVEMPEETFSDWHTKEAQITRTEFMANRVLELIRNERGIGLFGADHVEKKRNNLFGKIARTVRNNKLSSVIFVGGKNWTVDTNDYWIRKFELETQKEGRDKEFFKFKVEKNSYPCDYLLHFPQTESFS